MVQIKTSLCRRIRCTSCSKQAGLANAPVMIYSEDTTHIVTEEGIAYLYKAKQKKNDKQQLQQLAVLHLLE